MQAEKDPWEPLPLGGPPGAVPALRVDAGLRWDFFWSRGSQGERRLLLLHDGELTTRLPSLRGVAVCDVPAAHDRRSLSFSLMDPQLADPFQHFCRDLVTAASQATSEESAIELVLKRAWRWHRLLAGAPSGLLSEAEQKGLLGELQVLRLLMEDLGPADAVSAWRGPLGDPKDFQLSTWAVEAKARQGTTHPVVTISSADQLDDSMIEHLFLHVLEVFRASDHEGATISEEVQELRAHIDAAGGQEALSDLDDRLASLGFSFADDYSSWRWKRGAAEIYEVRIGFPRICASELPSGLGKVRYTIDLASLTAYQVTEESMRSSWREAPRHV